MNQKILRQTNLMAEISQRVLQIHNNVIFMLYLIPICLLNLTLLATDLMLLPMQRLS